MTATKTLKYTNYLKPSQTKYQIFIQLGIVKLIKQEGH